MVKSPKPNVRYVLPMVVTAATVIFLDLVIYALTPKLLLSWSADLALLSALLLLVNLEVCKTCCSQMLIRARFVSGTCPLVSSYACYPRCCTCAQWDPSWHRS
jgi:hypothetical protein